MKNFLVLVFLFVFTFGYSQFVTIPKSVPVFDLQEFIPIPGGGYISLKKPYLKEADFNRNANTFALSIVKYDKDMNMVMEQPLSDGEKGFSGYYAAIKESGNNFWVVYIERFKDAKFSSFKNIIARKIDLTTLKTGDNKIVADENSIDEKVNGYAVFSFKFMLESSQDKKHHALYINSGNGEFYISSLNENFETVWKEKQIIPGADQFDMGAFFPDNEGNILIFSFSDKEESIISHYSAKGIASHNKSINESSTIFDARFFTDVATGQTLVAGTAKRDSKNITDVFEAVLNKKSLQLENTRYTRIPEEIIATFRSNGFGSVKSRKYGLSPYNFHTKICGNIETGMNLIFECHDKVGKDRTIDVVGNLINVNFSSDKAVFSNIPRYSYVYTANKNGNYVHSFCKKNQVLVYLDNPENLTKSLNEAPTTSMWGKNCIIIAAAIAPDGSIIRKQIPVDNALGEWQSVNKFLATERSL